MSSQPNQWFVGRAGQQMGPYSDGQLRQLATGGQLLPTDLVWKEGMAEWVLASQLKGLFPAAAPTPAAAAPEPAPRPNPAPPVQRNPATPLAAVPQATASPARNPFKNPTRPATSASCWYCGVEWTHDFTQCPFCQMLEK